MKRFLIALAALLFCNAANAQIACNSASGFLKSFGPMTTGDVLVLGPDCEHMQDLAVAVGGTVTTRTQAQTLNLTGAAALMTLGYSTAADGGGALFKNVGNAPFIDSQTNQISVGNTGTGCTPGSYFGYSPSGGTGSGLEINFTIGGGGTMTAASITGTGGGGYTVGNVLNFISSSPVVPGCSVQPTIVVAGVTTPSGSFTDLMGNHFQIVPQTGSARINIRQFGARQNYVRANGDASASDDNGPIMNCLRFASVGSFFQDAGGYGGGICVVPSGASKVCNGLQIPAYVTLEGTTRGGSVLKQCDADNGATNFVTLGDPQNQHNAFDAILRNIVLFGGGSVMGTSYMVYSNSTQSAYSLDNVAIYSVTRGCIKYEIGYGGPSGFGVHGGLCVPNGTLSPSPAIVLSGNFSFTFDNNWQVSVGGPKWTGTAISLTGGGVFQMNTGAHCENLTICVDYDGSVGSPMMVQIISGVGNAALDKFVNIRAGSVTGVSLSGFKGNGTTCNVFKGGACVNTGDVPNTLTF